MILLIGSQGNMGRRYAACLDYLKEDYLTTDLKDGAPWPHPTEYDKAIVAVPTDEHYMVCRALIELRKDILCEKPVSKDIEQVKQLKLLAETKRRVGADWVPACDFRMVNNLWFALNVELTRQGRGAKRQGSGDIAIMDKMDIEYDHYHTGSDGLAWDACQLIYMADPEKLTLNNKSPVLHMCINDYQISLDTIAESYLLMLSQWLQGPGRLWGLEDAVKMTEKVNEYLHNHPV